MADLPLLPNPEKKEILAYRNIYTIKHSQDLFDDIASLDDIPILQAWDNATSQIDHSAPQAHRPFQYGDYANTLFVFEDTFWNSSRFSNGSFGVWYGAKDKKTSIMESLYWSFKNAKEDIARSKHPVTIDRKMFEAECISPQTVDLTTLPKLQADLVSEDYTFCQKLGVYAVQHSIGMYLTPSARNPGGVCTPVFQPQVIRKDRMLFFVHFTFFPNGEVQITTDEDQTLRIPDTWRSRQESGYSEIPYART